MIRHYCPHVLFDNCSATLEKTTKQFTYMEGEQYVFMDTTTFEETRSVVSALFLQSQLLPFIYSRRSATPHCGSLLSPPCPPPPGRIARSMNKSDWAKFLKEGMECDVLSWKGKVIGVDPPSSVVLEVTDTDPGIKGE